MRIKFVVLSVLIGCLTLFLGPEPGRTQNAGARPAERKRPTRRHRPRIPTPSGSTSGDWVADRFKALDRNGDGVLNVNEMTEELRAERVKWDRNGDCLIDLDEWRDYVAAVNAHQRRIMREQEISTRRHVKKPVPKAAARPPFRDQPEKRTSPRVFKLPSNLPAWFKKYDKNGDGQISLHEWKQKDDNEEEFANYDLNGDGFITVDELLRSGQFVAKTGKQRPQPQRVNALRAEPGEFFYFEVTGTKQGGVWGTDLYTADSLISTAAVHAGVLRDGETAFIKVTILPGQSRYRGTIRHGVTSRDFGWFSRISYRIDEIPR